eukprot:TRINITY_DN538_c0_g2_i5.p3 TRINITY_DN538_c0_g2~~TRINITY_DN538_c0_g2_i5.p3  ORF type:complete len:120 (-),score=16.32 TRINITY_DN538_c0_g2_i5:318-677(-)
MSPNVVDVSAKEAGEYVKKGYKYLDVRTPQEYSTGSIPDSVNIPFMLRNAQGMELNQEFMQSVKEAFPDMEVDLVVGCASGKRSTMACKSLKEEGYQNLINNTEGFGAYAEAGHPVVQA